MKRTEAPSARDADTDARCAGDLDSSHGPQCLGDPGLRRKLLRRRSSASEPDRPPGPSDLRAVLRRSMGAVDELLSHCESEDGAGQEIRSALETATSAGVVLTAAFAGTGCFEASSRQVFHKLAGRFSAPGRFLIWASWDNDHVAKQVLLAHGDGEGGLGGRGDSSSGPGPRHVFGDLLDRLFDSDRQRLLEIEETQWASATLHILWYGSNRRRREAGGGRLVCPRDLRPSGIIVGPLSAPGRPGGPLEPAVILRDSGLARPPGLWKTHSLDLPARRNTGWSAHGV